MNIFAIIGLANTKVFIKNLISH